MYLCFEFVRVFKLVLKCVSCVCVLSFVFLICALNLRFGFVLRVCVCLCFEFMFSGLSVWFCVSSCLLSFVFLVRDSHFVFPVCV